MNYLRFYLRLTFVCVLELVGVASLLLLTLLLLFTGVSVSSSSSFVLVELFLAPFIIIALLSGLSSRMMVSGDTSGVRERLIPEEGRAERGLKRQKVILFPGA